MKALIAIGAGGLLLAFMASRCKVGVHGPIRKQFVGDSWNPNLHVLVCARCGQQVYRKERGDD